MIVFFRAQTEFTDHINRDFWRKLRKSRDPFRTLTAVGGCRRGYFSGSLSLEMEELTEESVAYEITAALVQKIELLSRVGVKHIEFDEITAGVLES